MADSTARPAVPTLEITEATGKADGDPEPYVPNGAAASAGEGGAQLAPPCTGSPTGEGPRPRRSSLKKVRMRMLHTFNKVHHFQQNHLKLY